MEPGKNRWEVVLVGSLLDGYRRGKSVFPHEEFENALKVYEEIVHPSEEWKAGRRFLKPSTKFEGKD